MIQAAFFALTGDWAVFQGEDWFLDFSVTDENGTPENLTGYDQLFLQFRASRDKDSNLEATGVLTITAPATGGVRLQILYATTLGMTATEGEYTAEIAKSGTANSRRRILWGNYELSKTTIG